MVDVTEKHGTIKWGSLIFRMGLNYIKGFVKEGVTPNSVAYHSGFCLDLTILDKLAA